MRFRRSVSTRRPGGVCLLPRGRRRVVVVGCTALLGFPRVSPGTENGREIMENTIPCRQPRPTTCNAVTVQTPALSSPLRWHKSHIVFAPDALLPSRPYDDLSARTMAHGRELSGTAHVFAR